MGTKNSLQQKMMGRLPPSGGMTREALSHGVTGKTCGKARSSHLKRRVGSVQDTQSDSTRGRFWVSLVSLRAWQNLGDSGGRRATKGASHGVRRARQSHAWRGTQSFFFSFSQEMRRHGIVFRHEETQPHLDSRVTLTPGCKVECRGRRRNTKTDIISKRDTGSSAPRW